MKCRPADRPPVENEASDVWSLGGAWGTKLTDPSWVAPSKNVTVPVGAASVAATAAVKVTDCPTTDVGVTEEVSETETPASPPTANRTRLLMAYAVPSGPITVGV